MKEGEQFTVFEKIMRLHIQEKLVNEFNLKSFVYDPTTSTEEAMKSVRLQKRTLPKNTTLKDKFKGTSEFPSETDLPIITWSRDPLREDEHFKERFRRNYFKLFKEKEGYDLITAEGLMNIRFIYIANNMFDIERFEIKYRTQYKPERIYFYIEDLDVLVPYLLVWNDLESLEGEKSPSLIHKLNFSLDLSGTFFAYNKDWKVRLIKEVDLTGSVSAKSNLIKDSKPFTKNVVKTSNFWIANKNIIEPNKRGVN